jgi:hypothetical protein
MSYGTDLADQMGQIGAYAGRILKGEKPADLPIQQSTRVALTLNLSAGKALGLTFPLTLLGRAEEVSSRPQKQLYRRRVRLGKRRGGSAMAPTYHGPPGRKALSSQISIAGLPVPAASAFVAASRTARATPARYGSSPGSTEYTGTCAASPSPRIDHASR